LPAVVLRGDVDLAACVARSCEPADTKLGQDVIEALVAEVEGLAAVRITTPDHCVTDDAKGRPLLAERATSIPLRIDRGFPSCVSLSRAKSQLTDLPAIFPATFPE
jgi:hypothetical protein